jgi:hypothetical protein
LIEGKGVTHIIVSIHQARQHHHQGATILLSHQAKTDKSKIWNWLDSKPSNIISACMGGHSVRTTLIIELII